MIHIKVTKKQLEEMNISAHRKEEKLRKKILKQLEKKK